MSRALNVGGGLAFGEHHALRIYGTRVPRKLARHMERLILKVRAADRREGR